MKCTCGAGQGCTSCAPKQSRQTHHPVVDTYISNEQFVDSVRATLPTAPAQSDAPSAEEWMRLQSLNGKRFMLTTQQNETDGYMNVQQAMEAYAALRTARVQSDYVTERTYHAAWEKRAMQAEAEARELTSQRNMWKGIVTAGCDKHKDSPEEEYPADCFICQAAKVAQLEMELENRQEAVNTYVRLLKQTLDEKDAAEDRAQQWVKVSERLPNPEHTVLWCKVPICEPPIIGSIEDGDFEYATDFTHWMAMPNEFRAGASGAAGKGEDNG